MELEEIDPKVPKSAEATKKTLEDCVRRKRIQKFDRVDAKTFLAKAQYHLQAAEFFESENYLEWSTIAYYAGMYTGAKAFTSHFLGQAAKDHGCTIALMLEVLHGKKFAAKLSKARKKFEEEIELLAKVRQFRNSVLYTVTAPKEQEVKKIGKIAFEFVEEIETLLK